MNWELALMYLILSADDPVQAFREARNLGIDVTCLSTPDGKKAWTSASTFYENRDTAGTLPSIPMFQELNRTIDLVHCQDDIRAVVGRIFDHRVLKGVSDSLDYFQLECESDIQAALQNHIDRLNALKVKVRRSHDPIWSEAFPEIVADLDRRAASQGVTGIHTPWPTLTQATKGINPGDFWMLWGLPKHRKTFKLLVMAAYAARVCGERVLFWSGEMSWPLVRTRLAAIHTRIDYTRLTSNQLSVAEKCAYLDELRTIMSRVRSGSRTAPGHASTVSCSIGSGQFIFTDARTADDQPATIEDVCDKAKEYGATLVVADSAYMLRLKDNKGDPMSWKAHASRSAGMKRAAKMSGVPWAAGFQSDLRSTLAVAKSDGQDMDGQYGLAGYNMMIQDADIGINVVTDNIRNLTSLRMPVARESNHPGVVVDSVLCQSFAERPDVELFSLKDVLQTSAEEKSAAKAKPRRGEPRERASAAALADRFLRGRRVNTDEE